MDGYFSSANVRIMSGRVCQIIGNFKLLAIFYAMFAMFAICHQDIRKNFFLKTRERITRICFAHTQLRFATYATLSYGIHRMSNTVIAHNSIRIGGKAAQLNIQCCTQLVFSLIGCISLLISCLFSIYSLF